MSAKRKVLENSFLYTFSTLLVRAIGFLLLPVYTLFLSPKDYGITNLVDGFTQVTTFIIAFSLYSAVVRFYTDYKDDREKLKRFYGTVIIFIAISGTTFVSIAMIFNKILIPHFFEGISFYPVVFIALLTLTFFSLHTVHQSILQGMQEGKRLTIINLSVFGFHVFLNLLFIGFYKLGAVGVLLASLIINISYFIYMIFDLKKSDLITFCLDIKILQETLRYSIPIMPHNLSTRIASFAAHVFINNSDSLATVGLYSVASRFGSLIDTVQASVNRAFAPWFYDMMNKNNGESKRDIVSLSRFLLILYSLIYMGIGLFSQEVIILMTNERYTMAWTAIPILVIAFSVKSIYYFYINILFYYKKASRKIFISTITGSFSDIILAFVLVPLYGMYGAACSFLIAKIIVVSIVVVISKKYDDIGYKISSMLRIVLPSLLFMGVGLYFSYTKYKIVFNWLNLIYKLIIFFAYLVFVYITNRRIINRIVKSIWRDNKMQWLRREIKKRPKLKKWILSIMGMSRKTYMFLMNKIIGVNTNKIVFISFGGKSYSDNPRAISEKLYEMYPSFKIVWLFNEPLKKSKIVPDYIRCVKAGSYEALKELATAKFWVDNFCKSLNIYKSKKQIYIQTYHGDRGFKKILYDSTFGPANYKLIENKICDLVIAGSNFGSKVYRSAFKYEGEILHEGYPRNDKLIINNKDLVSKIKNSLNIEETTRIVLYAPTLRREASNKKSNQDIGTIDLIQVLNILEEKTNERWICLVRAHSAVAGLSGIPHSDKCVNVSSYEDMNELLLVSDLLITDYSSSAGDFALLERPIILFQNDREEYLKKDRTFYFDIDESPFMVAMNQTELVQIIKKIDMDTIHKNCKDILDFYETNESGKSSEAVADYIVSNIEEKKRILDDYWRREKK